MKLLITNVIGFIAIFSNSCLGISSSYGQGLERLQYNNPGLIVDLGVGLWAWPLPMDFDGDGDNDLVVVCPDKPFNGTYFFENASGDVKMPVFKPPVRISKGLQNVQVSYIDGRPRVCWRPHQAGIDFGRRGSGALQWQSGGDGSHTSSAGLPRARLAPPAVTAPPIPR